MLFYDEDTAILPTYWRSDMIGAIIGDIAGSKLTKSLKRPLTKACLENLKGYYTDDTVQTLAIAAALKQCSGDYSSLTAAARSCLKKLCDEYPHAGYGIGIIHWLKDPELRPYYSFGNGSAMRVSGCAYAGSSLEEVLELAKKVSVVTHNHPEGIKGAQAVAAACYLARTGTPKEEIRSYITQNFYPLDFTIAEIRDEYLFNATCQGTVPQALEAFFEGESFEDALLLALSLGGDSDTIGAMCGSAAEAFYGVPRYLREQALAKLDDRLRGLLFDFEEVFGTPPITD